MKQRRFLKLVPIILSVFLLFQAFLLLNYYSKTQIKKDSYLYNLILKSDSEKNLSLGRLQFQKGNNAPAGRYFISSIESNPLKSSAFIDFSEIFLEDEENEKAQILINRSKEITPNSYRILWKTAVSAFRLNDNELALNCLRMISKIDSYKVFDLSWKIFKDNTLIINQLVDEDNIYTYLTFLINKNLIDESIEVWNKIKSYNKLDKLTLDRYMDVLVSNMKTDVAYDIWKKLYGDSDKLIWNGGFEKELIDSSFGWKISEQKGADIKYDWREKTEGEFSLKIRFNGKENINFYNVRKVVYVKPNSDYLFSFKFKSEDITTKNGLKWELVCLNDRNTRIYSDEILGTHNWNFQEYFFSTTSRL